MLVFKLHAPRQVLGVAEGEGEVERVAVAEAGEHAAVLLGGTTEAVPRSLTNERVGRAPLVVCEGFWALRARTGASAYG